MNGERNMTLDVKKLAVIHIVKKELGLSDSEYRDQLEEIAGVRSAKDLDDPGFRRIMNYFVRSRHYRSHKEGITFRQKMYIMDLKEKLGWQETHFVNFLKKYYSKSNIKDLTKREATKVIIAFRNILE
jgi:hypothetical protein